MDKCDWLSLRVNALRKRLNPSFLSQQKVNSNAYVLLIWFGIQSRRWKTWISNQLYFVEKLILTSHTARWTGRGKTHACILRYIQVDIHNDGHTYINKHTHTHTHTLSLSLTHTHTHTHTYIYIYIYILPLPLWNWAL